MKDGKKPPSKQELQEKLRTEKDQMFKAKMKEYQAETKSKPKKHEPSKPKLEGSSNKLRDQLMMGGLALVWLFFIVLANTGSGIGGLLGTASEQAVNVD